MPGVSGKGLGKAGGSGVGPSGVASWRGLFQLDDSRQALPASEPQLPLLKRRKADTHLPGRQGGQVGMGAPWHLEGARRTGWHRAWWQVASLCGASVSLRFILSDGTSQGVGSSRALSASTPCAPCRTVSAQGWGLAPSTIPRTGPAGMQ